MVLTQVPVYDPNTYKIVKYIQLDLRPDPFGVIVHPQVFQTPQGLVYREIVHGPGGTAIATGTLTEPQQTTTQAKTVTSYEVKIGEAGYSFATKEQAEQFVKEHGGEIAKAQATQLESAKIKALNLPRPESLFYQGPIIKPTTAEFQITPFLKEQVDVKTEMIPMPVKQTSTMLPIPKPLFPEYVSPAKETIGPYAKTIEPIVTQKPEIEVGRQIIIRPIEMGTSFAVELGKAGVATGISYGLGALTAVSPVAGGIATVAIAGLSIKEIAEHPGEIVKHYKAHPITAPLGTAISIIGGYEGYKAGYQHVKPVEYKYEVVLGTKREYEKYTIKAGGEEWEASVREVTPRPVIQEIRSKVPLETEEITGWGKIKMAIGREVAYTEGKRTDIGIAGIQSYVESWETHPSPYSIEEMKVFMGEWEPSPIVSPEVRMEKGAEVSFYGMPKLKPIEMKPVKFTEGVKQGMESFEYLRTGMQETQLGFKQGIVKFSSELQKRFGIELVKKIGMGLKEKTMALSSSITSALTKAPSKVEEIQKIKFGSILTPIEKREEKDISISMNKVIVEERTREIEKIKPRIETQTITKQDIFVKEMTVPIITEISKTETQTQVPPIPPSISLKSISMPPPKFLPPPSGKFPDFGGFGKGIAKMLKVQQPKKYTPSITGILSGKEIKKVPKKEWTGLEIRYPVKRGKKKFNLL